MVPDTNANSIGTAYDPAFLACEQGINVIMLQAELIYVSKPCRLRQQGTRVNPALPRLPGGET
jgi:hypothetical protein